MEQREVDVAILGAGTAGLSARRTAKAEGASVVMIDPGPFGTTCARVGCMPSKLLIAAAEVAHCARVAEPFGVRVRDVEVDGPAVMQRVQAERDRFVGFVNEAIEAAKSEGELIVGRGHIVAPGKLRVDDHTEVSFGRLVVATGSSTFTPPPFRGLEQVMLTNESVFELDDLPGSLLVVGLGVIGLELGQAFARLGVRVTLVGIGGGVGPLTDPAVKKEAVQVFSGELDLHPDYTLHRIEAEDGGVRVEFTDGSGVRRDETFERVLMAAGRRPNLGGLGLENMGASPDDPIGFESMQLGEHPVFVAGDVSGIRPLLHEAAHEGRAAGRNAARFPEVERPPRKVNLGVVFSDPQIGIVGKSYAELASCEAVAGEVDYGRQGRARVHRKNAGRVRIYADKQSGVLLGAELFGPDVEHLSHLLAWVVQQGLTVHEVLDLPFYHPVVEEGLRTALVDLRSNLEQGEPVKCKVSAFGPGA
ncbi:MAG: dihydrolipoyl dehydrogenase [Nannocystaceae bacterium]|nr:dihydrolipoyl dehydrogenase [bacterium]